MIVTMAVTLAVTVVPTGHASASILPNCGQIHGRNQVEEADKETGDSQFNRVRGISAEFNIKYFDNDPNCSGLTGGNQVVIRLVDGNNNVTKRYMRFGYEQSNDSECSHPCYSYSYVWEYGSIQSTGAWVPLNLCNSGGDGSGTSPCKAWFPQSSFYAVETLHMIEGNSCRWKIARDPATIGISNDWAAYINCDNPPFSGQASPTFTKIAEYTTTGYGQGIAMGDTWSFGSGGTHHIEFSNLRWFNSNVDPAYWTGHQCYDDNMPGWVASGGSDHFYAVVAGSGSC
jgi:hypothetical protein